MAACRLNPDHVLSTSIVVQVHDPRSFANEIDDADAQPPSDGKAKELIRAAQWDNKDIAGSVVRFLQVAKNPDFIPALVQLKRWCHRVGETWERAGKTVQILNAQVDDDTPFELHTRVTPDLTIFRSFEEQKTVASLFETALI